MAILAGFHIPPSVSSKLCKSTGFSACPIFHIPPTRIIKNIGQKCTFFSTVPKNHMENLGFHWIFL